MARKLLDLRAIHIVFLGGVWGGVCFFSLRLPDPRTDPRRSPAPEAHQPSFSPSQLFVCPCYLSTVRVFAWRFLFRGFFNGDGIPLNSATGRPTAWKKTKPPAHRINTEKTKTAEQIREEEVRMKRSFFKPQSSPVDLSLSRLHVDRRPRLRKHRSDPVPAGQR